MFVTIAGMRGSLALLLLSIAITTGVLVNVLPNETTTDSEVASMLPLSIDPLPAPTLNATTSLDDIFAARLETSES